MTGVTVRWLVGLVLLVGAFISGYWRGGVARDNAWLAKQAQVERDANAKYVAEVKRGEEAAGAFIAEHQAMQSRFETLTEKFHDLRKRSPLVVPAAGAVCAGGAAPPPAGGAGAGFDAGAPVLTAGAVWMWNSALAGTDQPAGACGSLDTSEAACAVEAGLALDEAWENHATNARICAEDRLNHQRLIDYLKARP